MRRFQSLFEWRTSPRLWVGIFGVVVSLCVTRAAVEAQQDEDLLHTDKRLLTEERRQLDVRRRLVGIVRRIKWLLEDLDSNGLLTEGGGEKVEKVNKRLSVLGTTAVPSVASLLRQARSDLKSAGKHIVGAEATIE